MELCTSRHLLLSVFILQLIIVSVRQTFDFLGYMWASVLLNFVYTLVIIFGVFGVVQSKSKYTIVYTVSSVFWLFWNLFIMCIYFQLLNLDKAKNVLSFGTDSNSWWEINGPGCKAVFFPNRTTVDEDPYRSTKPDLIKECIVDFHNVEAFQAILHIILAIWGCLIGSKVSHNFISQNNCSAKMNNKKQNGVLPLYSIEYNPRRPEEMFDDDDSSHSPEDSDTRGATTSGSRPMTPRRVKRRSVNSRGTLPPQYQHRPEQQPPPYIRRPTYGSTRSSARSSRRHRASTHNPVSKFLEQQHQLSFHHQMLNDSSTSNDSCRVPFTSSQSQLLSAADLQTKAAEMGHINPNFASNTSLDRPPSARSSYSNYHGVRTLAFNKQATPQVPSNSCRRGTRAAYSTFFNDGPPAYEIQGVVDSETVI